MNSESVPPPTTNKMLAKEVDDLSPSTAAGSPCANDFSKIEDDSKDASDAIGDNASKEDSYAKRALLSACDSQAPRLPPTSSLNVFLEDSSPSSGSSPANVLELRLRTVQDLLKHYNQITEELLNYSLAVRNWTVAADTALRESNVFDDSVPPPPSFNILEKHLSVVDEGVGLLSGQPVSPDASSRSPGRMSKQTDCTPSRCATNKQLIAQQNVAPEEAAAQLMSLLRQGDRSNPLRRAADWEFDSEKEDSQYHHPDHSHSFRRSGVARQHHRDGFLPPQQEYFPDVAAQRGRGGVAGRGRGGGRWGRGGRETRGRKEISLIPEKTPNNNVGGVAQSLSIF